VVRRCGVTGGHTQVAHRPSGSRRPTPPRTADANSPRDFRSRYRPDRRRRDVEVVEHVGEPHLGERARLSIPLATPLRPRALHRYQRVDQDLAEEAFAPTRVEHLADVAEQRDAGILVVETGRQRDGGLTSLSAPLMTASVGDADQRSPVVRCAVVQLRRQRGRCSTPRRATRH